MIILRAIGAFFAKIGRWIRDTAWVQPLLIVGGIFAVIFSVPYFVNWVKTWGNNETSAYVTYYNKTKYSLKGCDTQESEVDGLFNYLMDVEKGSETAEQKKKYGEKFFLCFVQEGCSGCESNYPGFKYLQSKHTTTDTSSALYLDAEFKMHTVYTDQVVSGLEYDNIFNQFILENYQQVFEAVSGTFQDTVNYDYLINLGGESSSYYSNIQDLADTVNTPTIFLVDLSKSLSYGVSEVIFDVPVKDGYSESTTLGKALTLADCWNHADIFSENYKK